MEKVSVQRSPRDLGLLLKSQWQPGSVLVGVGLYSQGLSFYSGQTFHLQGCRSELDFGEKLKPESNLCLADSRALADLLARHRSAFLWVKKQGVPALKAELPGKLTLLGAQKDCLLWAYEGE